MVWLEDGRTELTLLGLSDFLSSNPVLCGYANAVYLHIMYILRYFVWELEYSGSVQLGCMYVNICMDHLLTYLECSSSVINSCCNRVTLF